VLGRAGPGSGRLGSESAHGASDGAATHKDRRAPVNKGESRVNQDHMRYAVSKRTDTSAKDL
jgi:hypothetical protein